MSRPNPAHAPHVPHDPNAHDDPESRRLREDARREKNWKRWGPYLSERQWATVLADVETNYQGLIASIAAVDVWEGKPSGTDLAATASAIAEKFQVPGSRFHRMFDAPSCWNLKLWI